MEKLKYKEIIKQEYSSNNCKFSGGFVQGHQVDTMYIALKRAGQKPIKILLRPDEVAAIAWIANGILWSNLVKEVK